MAGSRKASLPLPHAGLHAGSRVYLFRPLQFSLKNEPNVSF
jgi:hypothetical protein